MFGVLFSHIRMIYRKAKPQGTLLKEFREHVTKIVPPAQLIDDVLMPMADIFEQIADRTYVSVSHAEQVTTQVLDNSVWTQEIVEARQEQLVETLEDHWCLQSRKDPAEVLLDAM
jgi:hypothetical protein